MIDFKRITTTSALYNFHSHTQFCDGHAPMREFVPKAIELGFTDYGFSPHSPIPIPSPCNMKDTDVPVYIDEVNKLKEAYGTDINLYAAMEIDYLGDSWGPSDPYFDTVPLDYRIGSVHFIPCGNGFVDTDGNFTSFKEKMAEFFDNDIRHVVDTFYCQTLKMIEAGGFDIIGHFDKIGQNASYFCSGIENEDWYKRHIDNVICAIKDFGLIAEINTKSLSGHHRFFPNERYFGQIKKYGIPVIFNSDVHRTELINAGRQEAMTAYYNK